MHESAEDCAEEVKQEAAMAKHRRTDKAAGKSGVDLKSNDAQEQEGISNSSGKLMPAMKLY